jgi:hypothetical protein
MLKEKPMKTAKLVLAVGLLLMSNLAAFAQTAPPPAQTFATTIYFDWTTYLSSDPAAPLTGTDAAKLLSNKFQFRRAYFTYENKISDVLKFRFRIDADNQNNVTSVDFKGSKVSQDYKMRPFVKHLYLDYAGLLPDSSLKVGMVDTLPFKLAEDRWGYRSVAKTLADIYKDVTGINIRCSSADLGLNFQVPVNQYLRLATMIVNGDGYGSVASSKFRKVGGQVQVIPVAGLNFVGYYEVEDRPATAALIAKGAKSFDSAGTAKMAKADLYFDMIQNLNVSFEWFNYDNPTFFDTKSNHYKTSGWSVFSTYKIIVDKLNAFARYDSYAPYSTLSIKDQGLTIVGLDWAPVHSSWKIQPNVWFYSYKDTAKKSDVVANLTFFLSF